MSITIVSAYNNQPDGWLRGNLHTHTTNSDGPLAPQDTVNQYAERAYDFLMVSDHDMISDLTGLDSKGMTLIHGNEITANAQHMLHAGAKKLVQPHENRQLVIDQIRESGGFAIFCHPNWEASFNHCPQEKLELYKGYAGIEIFNGVTAWVEGNPYAADRWDRLLSQGRRIWGFANDDCHIPSDIGVGWSMVQTDGDRSEDAIVEALNQGRFYASTGVTIESITLDGLTLEVRTKEDARISAISDHGFRRAVTEGKQISFTLPEDPEYTYIRFECAGFGERKAWTQPFFIQR